MQHSFETPLLHNEDSSLMWYYMVEIPPAIAKDLKKHSKRVICQVNDLEPYHSALTPDGNGNDYVLVNKERRKKLGIEVGDLVKVIVKSDDSKYGMAVTESFTELCHQDPEGNRFFHALTPGKQRTLLHLMGKPKSEQKQLEKALIIFDYLKSVNGQLDFKELNEAFKNNRFKL